MDSLLSLTRFAVIAIVVMLAADAVAAEANPPVILAAGGDIIPVLEQFRALQGDNLGNKPAARKGRREINWDGVPDDKAAPAFLPADLFKGRGVILKTPGEGVQVSARAGNPAGVPRASATSIRAMRRHSSLSARNGCSRRSAATSST